MAVLPGLSEAGCDAIVAFLQGKVAALDARLNLDGQTPGLPTTLVGQIQRGDSKKVQEFPFWVTVVGGDEGGLEIQSYFELMGESGGRGFWNKYWATISCYLGLDTMPDTDNVNNVGKRDRLLSRLADWLRVDCFNQQSTLLLTLTSQEFSSGSNFDQLKGNVLEYIKRGEAPKGRTESEYLPCIRAYFVGDLA